MASIWSWLTLARWREFAEGAETRPLVGVGAGLWAGAGTWLVAAVALWMILPGPEYLSTDTVTLMLATALLAATPVLGLSWLLARGARPALAGLPHRESTLLDMVEIPSGRFEMGSTDYNDETPIRSVQIHRLTVARTPITEAQWAAVMGGLDGTGKPKVEVSWEDAVHFCNRLSEREGLQPCYEGDICHFERNGYRLPTEAEWEYACRAGTTTPFWWRNDEQEARRHAWFVDNARGPQPVGAPDHTNAWGLSDMAGNVWEWCNDCYGPYDPQVVNNPTGPAVGDLRVLRGGSWDDDAVGLRSANRGRDDPSLSGDVIGFRCVRVPRPEP